jgi:single-strand DNA-binding protein
VIEMDVDEIGPSLRYTTATVHRGERGDVPAAVGAAAAAAADPWASTSGSSEPPF